MYPSSWLLTQCRVLSVGVWDSAGEVPVEVTRNSVAAKEDKGGFSRAVSVDRGTTLVGSRH